MTNRPKKDRSTVQMKVRTELIDPQRSDKKPDVVAYAFSSGGHLLDRSSVNKSGDAVLHLPQSENAQRVRVIVGPNIEGQNDEPVNIAEVLRRGGEERMFRIDPDNIPQPFIPIIPDTWLCWLRGLCTVHGKLLKKSVSGGVSMDLPVCHATVEVYEVDPWHVLIPRLPDSIIDRLRDIILRPIPLPDPIPEPFPPIPIPIPRPDPPPFFANERGIRVIDQIEHTIAQPEIQTNVQPMAEIQSEDISNLRLIAATSSNFQFRNALLDYADVIRPIFCLYFPFAVTKQLVATTTTDDCGRFFATFSMGCSSDVPDLYFIAKQRILPFPFPPITIYEPKPVQCHTYWNHDCSDEVTLYTSHPLARTCPPCPPVIAPNNWVLMMAIGNYPANLIQHDDTASDFGRATQARSGGQVGSPFGGFLRFRAEFDNSLRDDLNVRYYRMSWRKGSSGAFTPMDTEVHRHYTHEVGSDLVLEAYNLGPKVVGSQSNLFEIPPALPPVGQWSVPDVKEDLTSAKWDTETHAPAAEDGLYEIKMELFDTSGNPVDISTLGIKYRLPDTDDLNGTIPTVDASTLGLVSGNDFVMTIHVDNNVCTATLPAPTLNSVAANPCGVLNYNPSAPGTVNMPFVASHPNDFATYSFRLRRGVNLLTPPTITGQPVASAVSPISASASDLLGDCPVAGFSEDVYVAAMAFNGWGRLHKFDAHANRAFVLAPQQPPTP
jgi:hypothetical protein